MKNILMISILSCSLTSSFAMASGVKISSFRYLGSSAPFNPATEMCGDVLTKTGQRQMIKITSDPGVKVPGVYYTWSGKDGKFCSVIASYTGEAAADLEE